MFANLVQLITGRPPPELEHQAFVREVRVHQRDSERRNPQFERLILICWLLIAVKHVAIIWAVNRYDMPFHQLWVNFPTWLFGVLATGVYFWHMRRGGSGEEEVG